MSPSPPSSSGRNKPRLRLRMNGGDASQEPLELSGLRISLHIGIDEAGRGCLAGPVAAAAVLFPAGFRFAERLPGLTDSKKLTEPVRRQLASKITEQATAYGLGLSWQDEVDSINILNATYRAMSRAALALCSRLHGTILAPPVLPCLIIDGNKLIPEGEWRACALGTPISALAWEQYFALPFNRQPEHIPALPEQRAVVGGDALVPSVSAASVLAKTVRDGIMQRLDEFFPGYGFARHKGYGTKEHLAAIAAKGPCRLHRMTFRGVRPEPGNDPGTRSLTLF